MLELRDVNVFYGKSHVLKGVDLSVGHGEVVGLLGRNGVGKTTTIRSIMGLSPAREGSVTFEDIRLDRIPAHKVARLGLGYVPQGRGIFPNLSVLENLCIGLTRNPDASALEPIFERFPILKERSGQPGGTLSGGEQHMLAIARCLIMKPKLILMDEPTEGIMPMLVEAIRKEIVRIHKEGVSILLVEQNVHTAFAVCDRICIMEKGAICYSGSTDELRQTPDILNRYLRVSM